MGQDLLDLIDVERDRVWSGRGDGGMACVGHGENEDYTAPYA